MEKCVAKDNVIRAWKRVQENGGSAGSDGMTIEQAKEYLRTNWPEIKEHLLSGSYHPKPVRKVEIPKPSGGVRQLGIPCVVDRLIQQCVLQILQPLWDPTFHPMSFGFRPKRSAHQAICQAQKYVEEGRKFVVDVDIEKFFDRVNHDILMDRVAKRIKDKRVIDLIRRYLTSGMMVDGVKIVRVEGTPQGGPLSPLLANLLLNEVDWELERRGLKFCRYADDLNVYVKSQRAAERGLWTVTKLLSRLRLRVNPEKSAADLAWKRVFLSFQFYRGRKKTLQRRMSTETIKRFRWRVKTLTRRTCGQSLRQVIRELRPFMLGWKRYFELADTPTAFDDLDKWIRRRLRSIILYQWGYACTVYRNLRKLGLDEHNAASVGCYISHCRSYWAMSEHKAMHIAFPNSYFDKLGLPRLKV